MENEKKKEIDFIQKLEQENLKMEVLEKAHNDEVCQLACLLTCASTVLTKHPRRG